MHHFAKVSEETLLENKPFHAECSCGLSSCFEEIETATGHIAYHFLHLSKDDTAELAHGEVEAT